jgi:hypothetical protein
MKYLTEKTKGRNDLFWLTVQRVQSRMAGKVWQSSPHSVSPGKQRKGSEVRDYGKIYPRICPQ